MQALSTAFEFQSTLPREERRARCAYSGCLTQFQSTLPREERLFWFRIATIRINFNPRSHERSDQSFNDFANIMHNFNPRSHERSDVHTDIFQHYQDISIHAPTRGATAILHKKFVYFYTIPTINI